MQTERPTNVCSGCPAWERAVCGLLLGLITVIPYLNSLHADFTLDGAALILRDSRLREICWTSAKAILVEDYASPEVLGIYRPATTASFAANYAGLGNRDNPFGYHVVNLALHTMCVFLALAVFRRVLPGRWTPRLAAALIAVHPVGTDAVTNLIGRSDLLVACFVYGGLLLHLRAVATGGVSGGLFRFLLAGCAGLAALSKESGVVLLPLMLLYDAIYRVPFEPGRSWWHALVARVWPWTRRSYAWAFLPVCGVWLWRMWLYRNFVIPPPSLADNPMVGAGVVSWQLTGWSVVGRYLLLLLWPASLSADYSYNQIPLVSWPPASLYDLLSLVALLAVCALVVFAAIRFRRERLCLFLAGFFLVTLLPASNLILRKAAIMGVRFLYLPQFSFAGCMALLLHEGAQRTRPAVAATLAAALLLGLGTRTWERNRDWKDEVTLFRSAVQVCPNSFRAHKALAGSLFRQAKAQDRLGDSIEEIIRHAETACAIIDTLPDAHWIPAPHLDLGVYYVERANTLEADPTAAVSPEQRVWLDKAEALYRRVLDHAARPVTPSGQRSRHAVAGSLGSRMIARSPEREVSARVQLACIYRATGRRELARQQLEDAVRLAPQQASIHALRAGIEEEDGMLDVAAVALIKSILLQQAHQPNAAAWKRLQRVYRSLSPDAPAVVVSQGSWRFNLNVHLVNQHLDRACRELHGSLGEAGLLDHAHDFAAFAMQSLGRRRDLFRDKSL